MRARPHVAGVEQQSISARRRGVQVDALRAHAACNSCQVGLWSDYEAWKAQPAEARMATDSQELPSRSGSLTALSSTSCAVM
jgi:hypothetical protein